ncbi:MAG: zinc metalloprotease HtpX [Candidatus Nanohaloarchaea archaeon]
MITAQGAKTNLKLFGLMSVLTGLFLGIGYFVAGESGLLIALVFAGVFNFGSYWFSDRIVLRLYGAEEITEEERPELHSLVEELAENAGIPKPRLYRNDMQVPNAFATGRSPEKGVVCVTEGLLNQLDHDEVAGVLAHELGHIKNRDTLINATVATVAGAIAVIARMVFWSAMFAGRDREGEVLASLAFMIVVPVIATVIRLAISRSMEFRADSAAVQIHGEKEGLSSALKKISSASKNSRYKASQVQEAGSNLFIENPFSGDSITKWFSTHPPLDERLGNIESTEV